MISYLMDVSFEQRVLMNSPASVVQVLCEA